MRVHGFKDMENCDRIERKDLYYKHKKQTNNSHGSDGTDAKLFSHQLSGEAFESYGTNKSSLNVSNSHLPTLMNSECPSTENQPYSQPHNTNNFPSYSLPPLPNYRQSHSVPAPFIPSHKHHWQFYNSSRGRSLGGGAQVFGTNNSEQYTVPLKYYNSSSFSAHNGPSRSNNALEQRQVSLPPITTIFRDIQMNETRRTQCSSSSSSASDLPLYSPHTLDSNESFMSVGKNDCHDSFAKTIGDKKPDPIDNFAQKYKQETVRTEHEQFGLKNKKFSCTIEKKFDFDETNAPKVTNSQSLENKDLQSKKNEQNKLKKLKQGRPITLDISVNLLYYESLTDYLTFLIQKSPHHTFHSKKQHDRSKEDQNHLVNHQKNNKDDALVEETKKNFLGKDFFGDDIKPISISVDSSVIQFDTQFKSKSVLINKQHYLNIPKMDASISGHSINSHVKVKPIRKPLLILVQNQSDLVLSHIKAVLDLEPLDGICLVKNYARSTLPNQNDFNSVTDEYHKVFSQGDKQQANQNSFSNSNDAPQPTTTNHNKGSDYYINFDYIPLANEEVINVEFFKKYLCYPKYRTNLKLVLIKKTPNFPDTLRVYLKNNITIARTSNSLEIEKQLASSGMGAAKQTKNDVLCKDEKIKESVKEHRQSYTLEEFKKDKSYKLISAMSKHNKKGVYVLKVWKIDKYIIES